MSELQPQPMTLEQAKQVSWLRNNPKPLGELLKAGYLNRSRLEWAAEKAYSPALRQAAKTILQAQAPTELPVHEPNPLSADLPAQIPLRLRLSLEDAQHTRWPFKPFAGQPMGELLDTQQLTLKDLGFAAERAYDARVREAAITLMSHRLEQKSHEPSPLMEAVKVISSGKSFAVRRTYMYTLWLGLLYGVFASILALLWFWSLGRLLRLDLISAVQSDIEKMSANPILIVALVIVTAIWIGLMNLFVMLFKAGEKWTEKKINQHERGAEGEERALEVIERTLDGQWTIFCNVIVPGQRGDIDMVLVGPSGLWALEIKNWSGAYRYRGETWQVLKKGRWTALRQNPSEQARRYAARLGEFLKADGIQQWVTPAVIWASPDSSIEVENPATALWRLERVSDELANIWQGKPLTEGFHARLVEKLTHLCEAERKRQQEMWDQ